MKVIKGVRTKLLRGLWERGGMLGALYDTIVWVFAVIYRFIIVAMETIRDHEFRTLGLLLVTMLVIGTVFYMEVEGLKPIDAFYLSGITITTAGYGDITPKTDVGKLFTVAYLFTGIGILLSFVNVIANHALKNRISVRLDGGFSRLRVPRPRRAVRARFMRYRYKAR
ncbi:MAG: two pore domain potassium channel family protein [Candidatus Aenigmarchaeota archaeon]|nr:two pore domain potassium channel family protein [Candidatus Aenigmarchaeota archaeon]